MIEFSKIENGNIFNQDFKEFKINNIIEFSKENISVIYGPNGTGKTSFIGVLADNTNSKVNFQYTNQVYKTGNEVFHIINDQNGRNIIVGETKDFFLGDNIRREFELQNLVNSSRKILIDSIIALLKDRGISAQNSQLIDLIPDSNISEIIKDIANNKSRGKKLQNEYLIKALNDITLKESLEYDTEKLNFYQTDIASKNSLIAKIKNLNTSTISSNPCINQIEENTEAISILTRFPKDQCVVCDTEGINWKLLLESKTKNRQTIIEELSEDVKKIIEELIILIPSEDPFTIKNRLLKAISEGNNLEISAFLEEIDVYSTIYSSLVLQDLKKAFADSDLPKHFTEYQSMINDKPELTEEDELYIQEIISNSMGKNLKVERDFHKNLKILLDDSEILGQNRNALPLSAGEQNFLSLTFEFLKAKNSDKPVVVIDDPISSFDSIYKNKVAYAIIKILDNKKRIILTHNIDLLRLLEGQYRNCYKLYILNNAEGEQNGFIPINNKEQGMLISLEKLLQTFKNDVFSHIKDNKLFLLSVVPFMRGYANIIGNQEVYEQLTELMHGYKTKSVDIAKIYRNLFVIEDNNSKQSGLPLNLHISVPEILLLSISDDQIVNAQEYPLLNKTLLHSFAYLYLRLKVEDKLVKKYQIDTDKNKQLGQIIAQAFPDDKNKEQIKNRVRLTVKKTLINEFNHFEGNLSIFHPAIDITDQSLKKEISDIEDFLNKLEETNE